LTAARHQATKHDSDQDDEDNPQESDNEDQARAARHSRSAGEIKPDTMAYYKGTPWWVILMQAKIKYRRHIAVNHGFPDRDQYLVDARDILLEAIDEFKTENEIHDQSELYLLYIYTFTYRLLRFPTCARNGLLSKYDIFFKWPLNLFPLQIFKEGATFRGKLKTVAHIAVQKAFRDELDPPEGFESQRDLKYAVERNVGRLLLKGNFLMNGKDNTVSYPILSYPILALSNTIV
jgi:Domain of unknown function (DUF6532)